MITALLCDDEQLALSRLARMIERTGIARVVSSSSSGEEALEANRTLRPDVAFLDVEMPELDGFDVVEEIVREGGHLPLIVFVTAHSRFALQAFDTVAIDFLSKPVRISRLQRTLQKVEQTLDDRQASIKLDELRRELGELRALRSPGAKNNVLWVRRRGERVRLDLDEADWIQAEGEYVRLVFGEQTFLHRETLSAIFSSLDASRFLRVHRSVVIAKENIASVSRKSSGSYVLTTASGVVLPVGRNYRQAVKMLMSSS